MNKLTIAFDVDDTIIIPSVVTRNRDIPNYETIAILKWFQAQGHTIVIWSGSGIDWAKTWAEKLGLDPCEIRIKAKDPANVVDLCFDDCDVELAKVNIKVKRIENSISREEWNKTKHDCICSDDRASGTYDGKHFENCPKIKD